MVDQVAGARQLVFDIDTPHQAAKQRQARAIFVSGDDFHRGAEIVFNHVTGTGQLPEAAQQAGVAIQLVRHCELEQT